MLPLLSCAIKVRYVPIIITSFLGEKLSVMIHIVFEKLLLLPFLIYRNFLTHFTPTVLNKGHFKIDKGHFKKDVNCLMDKSVNIMLTCPSNEHPLTPHFYIVKLGFTGVSFFLIFAQKHRLWVLVRTASLRRF